MKNSVDGSKSRYEKESTYPRYVYDCALFGFVSASIG